MVTVFGILNLTEDSFFDESRRLDPAGAVTAAILLLCVWSAPVRLPTQLRMGQESGGRRTLRTMGEHSTDSEERAPGQQADLAQRSGSSSGTQVRHRPDSVPLARTAASRARAFSPA